MVPEHRLGDLGDKGANCPVHPRCAYPVTFLLCLRSSRHRLQSKKANFDASHELEELLLEDNPLRARQRKERDISSLSAEMRQMEEQYVMVIQAGFFYQPTLSL